MRGCGEIHGLNTQHAQNSPYTTSFIHNTPTRTTQSQIREGQQLAHVHTRFILMLARWNAYRAHRTQTRFRVDPGSDDPRATFTFIDRTRPTALVHRDASERTSW